MSTVEEPKKTQKAKNINKIIKCFEIVTDKKWVDMYYARKHEREAAKKIGEEFTVKDFKNLLESYEKFKQEKYCPIINRPAEFVEKREKFDRFMKGRLQTRKSWIADPRLHESLRSVASNARKAVNKKRKGGKLNRYDIGAIELYKKYQSVYGTFDENTNFLELLRNKIKEINKEVKNEQR